MDNSKSYLILMSNNIKFGASYNVFDGIELLEGSIKSIRESVDFISVVYQNVSNSGQETDEDIKGLLDNLKGLGLVDEIFLYNPKLNMGLHWNELEKRKIGVYLSQNADCKYHLSADCDEFYLKEQLEYVKKCYLDDETIDGGYCQMQTFFKEPTFRVKPDNQYFVSLFFNVENDNNYILGLNGVVICDPTRNMKCNNPKIFKREEVEMYHYSFVRKNIMKKTNNSSSKSAYNYDLNEFDKQFKNYNVGDSFFTTDLNSKKETTYLVKNIFNINI